jgi:hypothetical protein
MSNKTRVGVVSNKGTTHNERSLILLAPILQVLLCEWLLNHVDVCGKSFVGRNMWTCISWRQGITEVKLVIFGLKLEALTAAMGSVSVFWVVIQIC